MAKVYTVKYVVDGMVVLTDKVLLTKEDIKSLEADGVIVKEG